MGLDMYASTTKRRLTSSVDFEPRESDEQFHYWRKHPNLHGWMEGLYRSKGGDKEFNCTTVELTPEDIDVLERAVKAGTLPATSGFFFGVSDGSEKEDDLMFIAKARAAFAAGRPIYYHSWW